VLIKSTVFAIHRRFSLAMQITGTFNGYHAPSFRVLRCRGKMMATGIGI
ncbi:unnamed protein product, partial [Acidithrix sp. C25]